MVQRGTVSLCLGCTVMQEGTPVNQATNLKELIMDFPELRHKMMTKYKEIEPSTEVELVVGSENSSSRVDDIDKYPSGEFVYTEYDPWKSLSVKLKMLITLPWERVKKGMLTMNILGEVSDQLKSRFSLGISLPQICENFIKAAYDPRISVIYLHIEPLSCGWGKVEEIRRHILDFKKSGKFILGYVPTCGEKEYYIGSACDELYAPPSAYFQLCGFTVQASFLGGVGFANGGCPVLR